MLSSISEQQKPIRSLPILPHLKKTLILKLSTASFSGKLLTELNSTAFTTLNIRWRHIETGTIAEEGTETLV
ncbi:hypothetical protein WG906_08690 [Pedobacter sp. P351]